MTHMLQTSELSILAVFLTGLLGGVHCAGMCGGIVNALGMLPQKSGFRLRTIPITVQASVSAARLPAALPCPATSAGDTFIRLGAYNLGRILTYTILGAIAGGVGSIAWLVQTLLPVQQAAFIITQLLLVLMGLYILGVRKIGMVIESWGSLIWARTRTAATARLQRTGGLLHTVITGSLWGLVPCAMVYAVLSAALVSGSSANGALLMLAFGLGTLPNLMAFGLCGQWLMKAGRKSVVRYTAGSLIVGFGLYGLLRMGMMVSDAAGVSAIPH